MLRAVYYKVAIGGVIIIDDWRLDKMQVYLLLTRMLNTYEKKSQARSAVIDFHRECMIEDVRPSFTLFHLVFSSSYFLLLRESMSAKMALLGGGKKPEATVDSILYSTIQISSHILYENSLPAASSPHVS